MGRREILALINETYGVGASVLTNVLVDSFAEGMLKDILEGRERTIENDIIQREAAVRVSQALKRNIADHEGYLRYIAPFYTVDYLEKANTFVRFEVRSPGLADQIYEYMELVHAIYPKYLQPSDSGRLITRNHYNESLETALRNVAFV